jgi:hypothetical protein
VKDTSKEFAKGELRNVWKEFSKLKRLEMFTSLAPRRLQRWPLRI